MTFDEAWEKLKSENPDVFTRAEQMADDFEESIQYAYDQGFKSGYELGKEERPQGEWYDHIPHKCLKARYGGYVLYDVDYLLKHLAMEIYLLEGAGRTRGEGE